MPPSQPLLGKTAVVTGASSGIGRSIARQLGAAGAHVTLGGRTRDAMEETAREIEKVRRLGAASSRSTSATSPQTAARWWRTRPRRRAASTSWSTTPASRSRQDRRRRPRALARDVRDQRARAAGRLAGGDPRDAQVQGERPHRQHLVGRRAAPRLGRLRRHQARGERDHRDAARGARGRADPRRECDARRDRDELRAQLRSGVRRRLRQGDRHRHRGEAGRAPARRCLRRSSRAR